jgi:lambda family phage portal protein
MGLFGFKTRKDKQIEMLVTTNKYQAQMLDAIKHTWDGSKYPGNFGLTKILENIDYWTLRKRSVQLFTENPYAKGIIRRILRNEIHTGLTASANPIGAILWPDMDELKQAEMAVKYGDLLSMQFELYANNYELFDFKKQLTFGEWQEMVRREALLCGDGVIISRVNKYTGLPTWDWVNGNNIRTPGNVKVAAGHRVVNGVELDEYGRHVAYYIQKIVDAKTEFERVPVKGEKSGRQISWMIYGSEKRADEVRGEPLLACVLGMLKDIDRYKDAEVRAAVINALIAFTVQKDENTVVGTRPTAGLQRPSIVPGGAAVVPERNGHQPIQLMQPGTVFDDLAPGEKVVSYQTNRPNVNYAVFEGAILDAICWSLEIPPEIVKLRFTSSYSASRQANNEFEVYLKYRNFKNAKDFCQIIYEEFIIQSVLNNQLNLPGFITACFDSTKWRIKAAWLSCTWSGLSRPSVERTKDVKAANDALDNGLTTFDDECRRLSGKSFRQTIQQLKNEINFAHQMGFNPHILEDNNGKDAYPEQTGNVLDSDVDNDDEE